MKKALMVVLYFISGVPTPAQLELAVRANARIRDVRAYREGDYIEQCHLVLGEFPEAYEKFDKHELHDESLELSKSKLTTEPSNSMNAEKLLASLERLDHSDDSHWTKGGEPDIKTVEKLYGSDVSRKDVNLVAPGLKRDTNS